MSTFKAKVSEDIQANRLIGLGGINTEENPDEGWETVYLIKSRLGWIPDLVSTGDLKEGDIVNVTISGKEVWKVEASENVPAGTLVQCDDDGRVKNYHTDDGNHFGFTTHSAQAGEVVEIVRKYGALLQSQADSMTNASKPETNNLTKDELKSLLDEKGIEYESNATKKELEKLLGGD